MYTRQQSYRICQDDAEIARASMRAHLLVALSTLSACCTAAASGVGPQQRKRSVYQMDAAGSQAHTYGDALRKTCQSLAIVGPIAFGWSAGPLALQPAVAMRVGMRSAQRWAGTSAGFTGGRAVFQVLRKTDDVWCAVAGAAAAALLGAPSFDQVPVRLAGFVALSYVLETQLLPRAGLGGDSAQLGRPQPNPTKTRPRSSKQPADWSYGGGARVPWGTNTFFADTALGKAAIRIDTGRQNFEDACVARLGGPAGQGS